MYFNEDDFINLEKVLSEKNEFYAHCKRDSELKETLEEHTERCKKYFIKLIAAKKMDDVFLKFEELYFGVLSEESSRIFRQLLMNTIVLHDIGKINPLFQSKKMKHTIRKDIYEFAGEGSRHSMISSILYIDYFMDKLKNEVLNTEERKKIRPFLFVNAYLISKHHSDLDDFQEYLKKLMEDCAIQDIIDIFNESNYELYQKEITVTKQKIQNSIKWVRSNMENNTKEQTIFLYTYARLLYSILVACDYYATTEFENNMEIEDFGELNEIHEFYHIFNNTERTQKIREYQQKEYGDNKIRKLEPGEEINKLRTELFLDTESQLLKSMQENIFFLEAPTGSGKSNTAFNLGFKLLEENKNMNKIFYVYPFNTLVEQNMNSLKEIFGFAPEILHKIAIINSTTPIKTDKKNLQEGSDYEYYAKALLNRQFLNYPFILTTHVSLFDTMFGNTKEASFAFHQLENSVIILDEIQSYKNSLWSEIIIFLKAFSRLLNMKVIIMSATLPNLDVLTPDREKAVRLNTDRDKYFLNPVFKNRVIANYDLLEMKSEEELFAHVKQNSFKKQKILIEFINKERAYHFHKMLETDEEIICPIAMMTGDDSSIERTRVLKQISGQEMKETGIILTATQVVEAGVDIDMDIGYKDISKLDSEEQFMGRINRSCMRKGIVYFFDLDSVKSIYGKDLRANQQFSLLEEGMREVLENKNFDLFYLPVLDLLRKTNMQYNKNNIDEFFKEKVGLLDFVNIKERMRLIEEDNWNISVYFNQTLEDETGTILVGAEIWENYKGLLQNNDMIKNGRYAEKQVKLSEVTSKMNHFIYQIKRNYDLNYNDRIGELYYIENGEDFFENGKLDKDKLKNQGCMFCDI